MNEKHIITNSSLLCFSSFPPCIYLTLISYTPLCDPLNSLLLSFSMCSTCLLIFCTRLKYHSGWQRPTLATDKGSHYTKGKQSQLRSAFCVLVLSLKTTYSHTSTDICSKQHTQNKEPSWESNQTVNGAMCCFLFCCNVHRNMHWQQAHTCIRDTHHQNISTFTKDKTTLCVSGINTQLNQHNSPYSDIFIR